ISQTTPVQDREKTVRLNEEAKKLLINVVNYPSLTITQRYGEVSLKGRYAQQIKNFLIDQKLIEEVFLAVGSSKQSTFLVPTKRALDYLKNQNIAFADYYVHIGKTSAMHQLLQAMSIELLRNDGCVTRNDYQVGEKFADIYAENREKDVKFIVEIAVNPAIDVGRLKSSLDYVDYFVIIAADLVVLNSMENSLRGINSTKIRLYVASNFLSALRKRVLDYNTLNIVEQLNSQNSRITSFSSVEQDKN
ncbi:MAG: hypothetical protein MN733_32780, partial [Nitrososphaera sp.]|nr:hypothetical protein [Nitrososphaera sp.]